MLLPVERHMKHIIEVNKTINQPANKRIQLSENGQLPHVSLLMGSIPQKVLPAIKRKMAEIIKLTPAFYLHIDEINNKQGVSSLNIKKESGLQSLHLLIAEQFGEFLTETATAACIYGNGKVSPSTLTWINNFYQKNTFDNFWPHITLGYGKSDLKQLITNHIEVDRLGLFHLGNHCTCEKALAIFPLCRR